MTLRAGLSTNDVCFAQAKEQRQDGTDDVAIIDTEANIHVATSAFVRFF
jgi:hypothetical protein